MPCNLPSCRLQSTYTAERTLPCCSILNGWDSDATGHHKALQPPTPDGLKASWNEWKQLTRTNIQWKQLPYASVCINMGRYAPICIKKQNSTHPVLQNTWKTLKSSNDINELYAEFPCESNGTEQIVPNPIDDKNRRCKKRGRWQRRSL